MQNVSNPKDILSVKFPVCNQFDIMVQSPLYNMNKVWNWIVLACGEPVNQGAELGARTLNIGMFGIKLIKVRICKSEVVWLISQTVTGWLRLR